MQGVKKYSAGSQIWRVIYPIIVYFVVQMLAEMAISFYAVAEIMPKYLSVFLHDYDYSVLYEYIYEVLEEVLKLTVPIMAVSAVVTLPLLIFYFSNDRADRKESNEEPPKKRGGVALACILMGPAACFLGNVLISLSGLDAVSDSYSYISDALYSQSLAVEIIVVGVLAPIVEEFVYRGLAFRRMRDSMSFLPAMLVSAFLFAFAHGNIVQGIYAFCLGMFLAYVYERSATLWAPVLLHITANVLAILMTELIGFQDIFFGTYEGFFLGMGISVAVLIVGVLVIERTEVREGD